MNIQDFDTYRVEELKEIKINDKTPESMTVPYDSKLIKQARLKDRLINDEQVFVVSTQKAKPRYRFKYGQTVKLQGPFFETTAECFGTQEYIHKGFRMIGYFFQWK
ncbi:TPA: hypothetical protein MM329_000671 [Escherichia coli]|nr:hypothetical protein [Escherichia coli]HBZ8229037.1 hypothetical protein [Escherichia coli]HBZ8345765.1 hypothetical protein [Escherichia coli]HBZ8350834.1 hypothetical protein [Escherichia coli]HBZ8356166.1 hypothetical protein [Escherichia coli]